MATYKCAHCGLMAGDLAGGFAGVNDADGKPARVCHPNAPGRPDCYRRVTVYREPLGALLDADPKPDGVTMEPGYDDEFLRRLDRVLQDFIGLAPARLAADVLAEYDREC